MNGKSVVCILQARMGSTRLPGKTLMDLSGKPLIHQVLDRLLQCKTLDKIVVATTVHERDDVIEEAVTGYGDRVFVSRGSEEDVLDRYYQAAVKHGADIVVRATGDNPMTDPDVIDGIVETLLSDDSLDYVSNSIDGKTFPVGLDVEAFRFDALERCFKEGDEPMDREHVTVYIKRNPESFKVKSYKNDVDLSHLRWTVDEENDYLLAKEIYDRLVSRNPRFRMKDVLELLEKEPALKEINQHVEQKNPQY